MTTMTGSNSSNHVNRPAGATHASQSHPPRRRRLAKQAATLPPNPRNSGPDIDLEHVAEQPGIDPCDVACDAMPGYVLGDLDTRDGSWLIDHTQSCGYCQKMLDRYSHLDTMLDTIYCQPPDVLPAPPPFVIPSAHRAGYAEVASPLGPLFVAASDAGVCEIGFGCNQSEQLFCEGLQGRGFRPVRDTHAVAAVARQLQEYFGGMRDHFEVPLDFSGVSPFTQSVLTATAQIPFGQLATYRDIAQEVGRPSATRAVGNALGRNPIPVIVPCHRILRSDHSLGGYTGGLEIKERLLSIEGVLLH